MKLIVGLGNYPKEYTYTRHNAGFLMVDFLQQTHDFEEWGENKKLLCQLSKGSINGIDCLLAKPQTLMNLSGDSVIKIIQFYKIAANDLLVIHDEIDLPFATIKQTQSRNSAGHNGIKSVNSYIKDIYNRIRIGVGRPANKDYDISDYVLSKFSETELPTIKNDIAAQCNDVVMDVISGKF